MESGLGHIFRHNCQQLLSTLYLPAEVVSNQVLRTKITDPKIVHPKLYRPKLLLQQYFSHTKLFKGFVSHNNIIFLLKKNKLTKEL